MQEFDLNNNIACSRDSRARLFIIHNSPRRRLLSLGHRHLVRGCDIVYGMKLFAGGGDGGTWKGPAEEDVTQIVRH